MARRFKDMQTPEQQHAARDSHALRGQARAVEGEIGDLAAPRRSEGQYGHVTAVFGPHSDRDQARVDQLQATARDLRAAADAAETVQPKKRRWL